MSAFMLSQLLITVAIIFDLISFQFKQKRFIVACLAVSCVLSSTHFVLLEQWTAAALMMMAAIRYFVTIFSHDKRLLVLFLSLNSVLTYITFAGVLSLVSFAGSTMQTLATFCKTDQLLRQLMIIGTSIWLLNNLLVGSPMAALMEFAFICSNLVGYYRYYGVTLKLQKVS
ncbi:YgjV family protein [Shewanella sp. Isolate11]|uniref:YgjV family protein n=1 Tax=Shewanella sp. Isolate11 TaxID=2908530 RepID=UPI001EFCD9BB|nr:YgjV family protein [Shewanella sp. Isolate11]MCG9696109.1 YgjV family protein [Shewanella sp. Isolate11]